MKSNCLRSWRTGRCSSLCLMGISEAWRGLAISSLTLWWSSCKDLQPHKEIVFPIICLGGSCWNTAGMVASQSCRSHPVCHLPQVCGCSNTSVDSTGALSWWEQLLCPPVFPPSLGKGLWKLLGNTTQCLPHKVSSHLRRREFYSSCFVAKKIKKVQRHWISENGGSS